MNATQTLDHATGQELLELLAALSNSPAATAFLLTQGQAAEILGFSPRTLADWRLQGDRGPKFVSHSRRSVRYRLQDLTEWCEANLRRSTSDQGDAT